MYMCVYLSLSLYIYIYIYVYICIYVSCIRGYHFSNTTCLKQVFFKNGK